MGGTWGSFVPRPAGAEAAWAGDDIDIIAVESLLALVNHLAGRQIAARPQPVRALAAGVGPTLPICAARTWRAGRSKSRRPGGIIF